MISIGTSKDYNIDIATGFIPMFGQVVILLTLLPLIIVLGVQVVHGAITIDMKEKTYYPETVNVKLGEPVIWHNEDNIVHTATSGQPDDFAPGMLFNTGAIFPGSNSAPIKLNEKGEIQYFCQIHPFVTGLLKVS